VIRAFFERQRFGHDRVIVKLFGPFVCVSAPTRDPIRKLVQYLEPNYSWGPAPVLKLRSNGCIFWGQGEA